MSIVEAKTYIRRLRTEVPLRRDFELVWQGKRRQPDGIYRKNGKPVVPQALEMPPPDDKTDPTGNHTWWRRHRAQQDIHDLLFSKGEGHDHAQDYVDGAMVTDARIAEVIDRPEMTEALGLLARIATACTGDDIATTDMKAAWHAFVRWIFKVTDYSGTHPEVRRLRKDAAGDEALRRRIDGIVGLASMSEGAALALQNFMESGFAADAAYESLTGMAGRLADVAAAAREAGYDFTALDYLKDCIFKRDEDDPGPELDDRYWPEDDPNVWNYERPPVRFGL